uniref:Uncharacterized protein n=1 Tax=Arundo donax TaxID=35708 RepID=A0A0A8XZJ2_ARUDO
MIVIVAYCIRRLWTTITVIFDPAFLLSAERT